MWRATVIERIQDGQVVVSIPALFRGDPVGPMQSAVDAQVGDAVIVADLRNAAKVRDWWVLGYESQIGRWGDPYPHEHPLGQVTGLVDALAAKADDTDLTNYATTTALTTGLSGKVNTSTYTTGLSGKADKPGAWQNCTPSTYITKISGADIQARTTPDGIDIRSGRWFYSPDVPRDSVIFTLPAGLAPPVQIMFQTSGMSNSTNNYNAITVYLEARPNGTVTARSAHVTSPSITLSQSLFF